jgi:DNA-binding CsgD family transcriptional regulator
MYPNQQDWPPREVAMGTPRSGKSKRAVRREPRLAAPPMETGMVLLDPSLRPIAFDQGAAAIFRDETHRGPALPPFALPREIMEVIRRSKPGDASPAEMRFRLGTREFTCQAYRLQALDDLLEGPVLALYLQRDLPVFDALTAVGAEYRLTDREYEVLKQIAGGLTSKEVAERMKISPNTVKVFLRMIMVKMGVSTRSGVIAKLLEHNDAR